MFGKIGNSTNKMSPRWSKYLKEKIYVSVKILKENIAF